MAKRHNLRKPAFKGAIKVEKRIVITKFPIIKPTSCCMDSIWMAQSDKLETPISIAPKKAYKTNAVIATIKKPNPAIRNVFL